MINIMLLVEQKNLFVDDVYEIWRTVLNSLLICSFMWFIVS